MHYLIDSDPAELFDPESLYQDSEVFDWSFGDSTEVDRWQGEEVDVLGRAADGVTILSSSMNPRLERDVDVDASTVDVIEVRAVGLRSGRLALLWAVPGTGLTTERRIVLSGGEPPFEEVRVFRFQVGLHPGWKGRIRRLRLGIASPAGREIKLLRVRGISQRLVPERLAQATERAWKVDREGDVRSARLAIPGQPVRYPVSIPRQAELRFSWSAPEPAMPSLRVVFSPDRGPSEVVYERSGDDAPVMGWHEERIDLSRLAGQTGVLELVSTGAASEPIAGFAAWGNPRIVVPGAEKRRPDVVLVSVDTLRADRLSLYGYPRPTSPHLDTWAAQHGVVFRNTAASAPWTLPSHVSMFTGIDAHRHGVNYSAPAPSELQLLAEWFRDAGYETVAVTGGGFLRPEFGLAQGFDRFHYWPNRARSEDEMSSGIDRVLSLLDRRERPLFVFFHTYEVHSPYLGRQPFLTSLSGRTDSPDVREEKAPVSIEDGFVVTYRLRGEGFDASDSELARMASDLYDSGVAYADVQLGRLLERLTEPDLRDQTIVAITSDHGEMLGEDGLASHAYLTEENLLVPLIVSAPGLEGGRQVERTVRSVDLPTTLADLAGLTAPENLDGVSLAPLMTGDRWTGPRVAWSYAGRTNRGIALRIDGRWKVVFDCNAWSPWPRRQRIVPIEQSSQKEMEQAEEAIRWIRRELRDALPGPRVRLTNGTDRQWSGRIEGGGIDRERVETPDLACDCVHWSGSGVAEVLLPPGESYTLILESASDPELHVVLEPASGEPDETLDLSLSALEGVQGAVFDGAVWRPVDREVTSGLASVAVWWGGDQRMQSQSPVTIGKEVLDELRALGYVD